MKMNGGSETQKLRDRFRYYIPKNRSRPCFPNNISFRVHDFFHWRQRIGVCVTLPIIQGLTASFEFARAIFSKGENDFLMIWYKNILELDA